MLVTSTGFIHLTRDQAQVLLSRSVQATSYTESGTNLFVISVENDENRILVLDEDTGKYIDFHVSVSFNMERGPTLNINDPGTKMRIDEAFVFSPCTLILSPEQQIGYTILGQSHDLNTLLVFNIKTCVFEVVHVVLEVDRIKPIDKNMVMIRFEPN